MDKKLKYTIGVVCLGSLVAMLWLWVLGYLKGAPNFSTGVTIALFVLLSMIFFVEPKKQE